MGKFAEVDRTARGVLGDVQIDNQVGARKLVRAAGSSIGILSSLRQTSLSALVGPSARQLHLSDPGPGVVNLEAFEKLEPTDCRLRVGAWDYHNGTRLRSLTFWFFYTKAGQRFSLYYTSGGVVTITRAAHLGGPVDGFYLQRIMTPHIDDFIAQFRAALPS
jgi:hypothetical protein